MVREKSSMSSLGISPLVAAVLLIAVTMTIAGLLTYWATSYVRTSLPETNQTEIDCRFADFSIYSCTYYNSTNQISIILENHKNVELTNLNAFLLFENSTVSDPKSLGSTLPAGGTLKSFQIGNITDDFSKIIVTTQCPELSKEKVCTKV
jgi:archaellum component FlaF (FlaF/FlaG flagellin family)